MTAKFAVTLRGVLVTTEHGLVPVQSPDQPVNVCPEAGASVIVTVVFGAYAKHIENPALAVHGIAGGLATPAAIAPPPSAARLTSK